MKKTILKYGLISGAISAGLMLVLIIPLHDRIGFDKGMVVGYTIFVLSFLMVFFGVRSYRENVGGGSITFGKAFTIGILITLISCACYVIAWEFTYFFFAHDFLDKYAAYQVAQLKASGKSPEAINEGLEQLKKFKEMYNNPLINAAFPFTEPFPVGVLITLLTALILRKKKRETIATDVPLMSS